MFKLLNIMSEECLATPVASSVSLATINLMMVIANLLIVVICIAIIGLAT